MCLLEVPKCFNSQHAPYCAKTSFQDKQGTAAHLSEHIGHFMVRKMSKLCIFDGGNVLLPMPWAPPLVPKMPPTGPSHEQILFQNPASNIGGLKIRQDPTINFKYCKYNPESLLIVSHCIVSQIIQKLKMSKVAEFWPNFFRT